MNAMPEVLVSIEPGRNKLGVFEDLRHGHLAFIAASIFLFAVTLIVVPRVARTGLRT